MARNEILLFSFTLLLALIMLAQWKRRHELNAARVRKGLRGYVATKGGAQVRKDGSREEQLLPVAP